MVSVLFCTHNSRALLPIAIESYLSQDYPDRELVVIDDGDDLIEDMVRDLPGVQYHLVSAENLSQKRNAGIRLAKGELIAHFDSDDFSGPRRISHQVAGMQGAKVAGYGKAFWFHTGKKLTTYASCGVWGATLCYERNWALEHPWNEASRFCEDVWFLDQAKGMIADLDGGDNFVALAHDGNAARPFGQPGWEIVSNETLPAGFRKFMGLAPRV